MYQLEVKQWLVAWRFPPSDGWSVWVDVDAMERAKGGKHPPDKRERAQIAEASLRSSGVQIGAHPQFGRADVVAEHPQHGLWLIEAEGQSSRQREQAIYSALGQLVLQMRGRALNFALATPNDPVWERQLRKVPMHARAALRLHCWLVSPQGITEI